MTMFNLYFGKTRQFRKSIFLDGIRQCSNNVCLEPYETVNLDRSYAAPDFDDGDNRVIVVNHPQEHQTFEEPIHEEPTHGSALPPDVRGTPADTENVNAENENFKFVVVVDFVSFSYSSSPSLLRQLLRFVIAVNDDGINVNSRNEVRRSWMEIYDAEIPFNAVNYDSFKVFCEALGHYSSGIKPPSFHEVRVPLFEKEVENTSSTMKDHVETWAKHGCSILSNDWKDKREKILINFLVNCPKGSMFIESVDASSYAKTGESMFKLLSKFMEKIDFSNVVQVVTDSASNNVLAGRLLEAKYLILFWTPCAAYCLDLILEDIYKLPNMKKTFERVIMVNSYIYNRSDLLSGRLYMVVKHQHRKNLPSKLLASLAVHLVVNKIGTFLKINELLTERIDDQDDRDDEAGFLDDDGLTWNDVARAAGVGEPSY
ncbi:hypothetical protein Q3G72_001354 [Acer saccharum]|nr:hypothetical protein Q3G72_001354 [Acer saccharum]